MAYVKVSACKYWYNMDSADETARQLATSAVELVGAVIIAGAQPMVLRIHDSATGAGASKKSILIACNQGESFQFDIVTPLSSGLYVVIEQGAPSGEAAIFYR